jgi:hypothetical protein
LSWRAVDDIKFLPEPVQEYVAKQRCKLCREALIVTYEYEMTEHFSNSLVAECSGDHFTIELNWRVASDISLVSEGFYDDRFSLKFDYGSEPVQVECTMFDVSGNDTFFPLYKHFEDLISKDRITVQELIARIEAVQLLQ